ncbi:MAG: hypothetical protein A3H28_13775 [Acidobacteria bacterium RIFCSPLOWO2_02_FULL_61_28]|nr:MAG: hypothetical protein A3H28_13775 [Acidobacteria bacterium RIFCSPLOWO2_02_FULL_61_28]
MGGDSFQFSRDFYYIFAGKAYFTDGIAISINPTVPDELFRPVCSASPMNEVVPCIDDLVQQFPFVCLQYLSAHLFFNGC